ncbi:MAG: chorismate mutase [Caulobacteraceae bacterium]
MAQEFSTSGKAPQSSPDLSQVRARLDVLDAQILKLVDERASIANLVAEAKRAAGDADKFALRPAREAQVLRQLLATPRQGAGAALTVRLWRELIGDSLARQGPFHLSVFGGADPARAVDQARMRFGNAPPIEMAATPEAAIAAAKTPGGVAVLSLASERAWWGRLLVEPELKVFAALPCLAQWGPTGALAAAKVEIEPTGDDQTFWLTDAPRQPHAIIDALARDGVAASLIGDAGGLMLFSLAGFYMPNDERLARAPGRLTGVIGAAPIAFDAL